MSQWKPGGGAALPGLSSAVCPVEHRTHTNHDNFTEGMTLSLRTRTALFPDNKNHMVAGCPTSPVTYKMRGI